MKINNDIKNLFLEQFNKVFNENEETNLCGRNECIQLIKICNEINPGPDYGSITTGFINIKEVKELKKKLTKV